jgi:hypothetical protein
MSISNILVELCFVGLVYFLSVFIGTFIKRINEFYYPVIFGLMYGNYLAITSFYNGRFKCENV